MKLEQARTVWLVRCVDDKGAPSDQYYLEWHWKEWGRWKTGLRYFSSAEVKVFLREFKLVEVLPVCGPAPERARYIRK